MPPGSWISWISWFLAGISFALNGRGAGQLQKLNASPVEFDCHSPYRCQAFETQDLSVGFEKRATSWSQPFESSQPCEIKGESESSLVEQGVRMSST